MTLNPVAVMTRLDEHAIEMDRLSKQLAEVERQLEPVTLEYEEFVGAYEEGLWDRHVQDGAKLPAEALRKRMAHRAMPPELLGRFTALSNSRKRMEQRIASLKTEISAQQSILSALKAEAQASGSGMRSAA